MKKTQHALVGLGSAAIAAAVAFLSQVRWPNFQKGIMKCKKRRKNRGGGDIDYWVWSLSPRYDEMCGERETLSLTLASLVWWGAWKKGTLLSLTLASLVWWGLWKKGTVSFTLVSPVWWSAWKMGTLTVWVWPLSPRYEEVHGERGLWLWVWPLSLLYQGWDSSEIEMCGWWQSFPPPKKLTFFFF